MLLKHGITTEMLAKAIVDSQPYQDHYYIGQFPDGYYYGVIKFKVKSRSGAAQVRSADYFEKYHADEKITPIKVMKRK
jgi:hypothetical protein